MLRKIDHRLVGPAGITDPRLHARPWFSENRPENHPSADAKLDHLTEVFGPEDTKPIPEWICEDQLQDRLSRSFVMTSRRAVEHNQFIREASRDQQKAGKRDQK